MESYDLSNIEVLIVDQNQHMLSILRSILAEFGIEQIRATSEPDEAFQMFKEHPVDIIFSDWVPGRDELKFLNKVRNADDSPNRFVPIIVVTAYTEKPNVVAARDLGMTEFLATPISARTVYEHLCAVIKDERPFIEEKVYFGPDRRRHRDDKFKGEEQRKAAEGDTAKDAPAEDAQPDPETPAESGGADTGASDQKPAAS